MMSEVNLNNSLPPVFYTKNDDTSQTEVKAQEEILPNVLEKFGLSKFQTHLESLKQWRFGLRAPDAATNFTHALKNLADGEEIWIPYTDEINIGFKKNSAKKFDITVINISANSCYHPFICINGELLSKTCMVKQNIPTDKLYDPIIIDRWLKESPKINQAQHLYENFLPFLGGQSVKFEEHFDKVDSCLNLETKGKLAIIRHKLRDDRARYKKLKLDFMQAKLAQISQLDTSDDHLAQISQHAKRVLKFSDQTDLQSKYYQQSKEVKNSLQPPNHNFAVEYLDSYEYESEIKPEKQKRLLCFDSVGNTFIEFEKWREDKNYHTFNPSGDLESVRNFIMENKIFSLPKLSDPFWETITTDAQIEAWIELLVYFYVHKTRRDKRGDSKNLSFFFLQAITDKLARQHSSLKKPLAGLDLFSKDNLVNFAYEPFNQQDNPYDQTILNDILTYHGLEDFDPARDGLKSLDSKVVFSRPKKTNYGYKFNRKVADLFTQRYTGKKDPKYTNQILIDGPEIPPLLSSLSKISYENSEQVKDGGVQVQPNFCLEKNFLTGSENISFSGKTNSSIKDNFGMPTPSGFIPQNYAMADKSLSNDITYNAADKVFRLIEHFSNDSFDDEKDQHRFKRAFLQGGMLQKSLAKEPRVAIALIDILSQTLENSNPNAEKTEPKIDILLSIQNDIVQHIQFAQHNYPVKYEKWQSKIDQLIDDYHLTLKKYRSEINSNQTIDAVKKLLAKNSLASESAKVVITGDAIEINDADRTYKLVKCNQYSYDVIWLKDDNEYFLYEPNSSFKDKKIWKCNKDSHHILEDKDGSLIYCNNEQYSQNLTSEIQFKWTKDIHKQHPFKGFANEGLVRYGKIHKADEASVNAFMLSNKLYFIEDNEKLKCELHPNFCFDTAATIKWRSKLQNPQLIALKSNDNREKILINGNSKPWSYYEYDVKQLESGEHILCPADSKSHLALIQNLMKSNQLVAAEKYIKTLNLVQGIDDDTKLILIDLLSTGQFTANCLVLKLRLMLELAKNLNFYGHQDHDEIKKNFQESIYNQYLQQKRFLTLDSLSKQEELQIINFIEKKTRAQQIRAEHLTSGKLKEQKSSRRPKPPIFSAAAASFIKSISFFHSTPRSMNARKIDLHNINIDALNVADNFDELQSIAIYGTKKQKASIKILVEFTTQTPKNRFRITYLKCLLSFPRLFPRLFFPYVFVGDKTKFLNYVALAPTGLFMTIHDLACNHIFTPNRAHSIEPILKFNPVNLKIETSTQTAEQLIDINENLFNSKIDTNVAAILNRLNRVPQNMQTDLRKISGEIKEANFEEALLLFLNGKISAYQKLNPYLTEKDILEIDSMIASYLAHTNIDAPGQRNYDATLGNEILRNFLVFEYQAQIYLRENQVESIKELAESQAKEIVTQQGTGSGKSKVQFPLLQRLFQLMKGAINVWPSALFPTNRDDIQKSAKDNFNQKAEAFTYHRSVKKELSSLKFKYNILNQAMAELRQISTRPSDVQSLELALIELLYDAEKGDGKAQLDCFYPLQGMLKNFKKTKNLTDEAHVTQNPKTELNYSLGSPQPEPERLVEFMAEIFSCLTSPQIENILHLRTNCQHDVSLEEFKAAAQKLIELMLPKLKVDQELQNELINYLTNEELPAPKWLAQKLNRDKIALLRGVACNLLRDSFYRKAIGTNYGCKSPTAITDFAIPYSANNTPVANSEYDNSWETLIKTFHIYTYHDISEEQAFALITCLQARAKQEASIRKIAIEDTKAYRFFESIKVEIGIQDTLPRITRNHSALSTLSKNDKFKFQYVSYVVAPKVKKYPQKISSNVQNIRSQFDDMITMSATPIDEKIYAPRPHFISDKYKSDELVEQKVRGSSQVHKIDANSPAVYLNNLLDIVNNTANMHMLIDSGAMLKGVANLFVAQQILKETKFNGVLFFDENEEMMVLERGHSAPVALHRSEIPLEELFTYCDHKHIFGADTKQIDNAIGLCTIGKQTTYEELIQGAGRLRKLLINQSAHFVTNYEQDLAGILKSAKENSQQDRENRVYKSIKHQIHNEVRSKIMSCILNCKKAEEAVKIFQKTKHILVSSPNFDVWQMYGLSTIETTRKDALLQYLDEMTKVANNLNIFTRSDKKALKENLAAYKEKINQCEFTTKIKQKAQDLESYSEKQTETEKELEQQVEAKSSTRTTKHERRAQKEWSKVDLFNDNWLKCDSIRRSFKTSIITGMINLSSYQNRFIEQIDRKMIDFNRHRPAYVKTAASIALFAINVITKIAYIPLYIVSKFSTPIGLLLATFVFDNKVELYDSEKIFNNSSCAKIKNIAPLFKDNDEHSILVTSNFMPMKDFNAFDIFSNEQKHAYNMLVVKENDKYTAIMGDQTSDTTSWINLLQSSNELENDLKREVFVYDLQLNNIKAGSDIELKELENDDNFQKMLIKVKLLNGDSNFNYRQLKLIDSRVQTKADAEKLNNFMLEITRSQPEKKLKFLNSALFDLIKDRL